MEEARVFETWFQPGPRPARDAFNHGVYSVIHQELALGPRSNSRLSFAKACRISSPATSRRYWVFCFSS